MGDRPQQLRIQAPETRQRFRIPGIVLIGGRRDQPDPAGIRHNDLVAPGREETAHPRRLLPRLEHDPLDGTLAKPAFHSGGGGGDAAPLDGCSRLIHRAQRRPPVAHIESRG